jgi:phospholipase A1
MIDVTLLNDARADAGFPDRIAGTLTVSGTRTPVTLELQSVAPGQRIGPGQFAQARYLLRTIASAPGIVILSLQDESQGYAFVRPTSALASPGAIVDRPDPDPYEPSPAAKPDEGNAFLGNLSSYAPVYAVYGPGTSSDGRLQISFKYQLFGEAGAVGGDNPFLNGVHFGYTQRLFWDLGGDSSPFRNIDFMPELFYLLPTASKDKLAFGGQAGLRHESNGRDALASRSLNTFYVQPMTTIPLGDYKLSLGPRYAFYVGDLEDNPDVRRYRGNTSLFAEFGRDDGLRLTTNSRINFSSGKGAIDASLSYPLNRIVATNLNVYVFSQAFAGYGENLLDYNRKVTRLRIGAAIVR